MLFHVSEEPGIAEFIPRPSKYTQDPVVWAVDDEKIRNYLVPRDCPRVTYYADSHTAAADSERFLGKSTAVVAIEASSWQGLLHKLRYFDIADQIDTILNGDGWALPGQQEAAWQRLRQCLR